MELATLKTLMGNGEDITNARTIFGVTLIHGETIQLAHEPTRQSVKNVFSTVWKIDDASKSLVVRQNIATVTGASPVVVSYYSADSIIAVHKFCSDTQIQEDDAWKMKRHDAEKSEDYKTNEPSRILTIGGDYTLPEAAAQPTQPAEPTPEPGITPEDGTGEEEDNKDPNPEPAAPTA